MKNLMKKEIILVDDNPIDLQICQMIFKRTMPEVEFKIFDGGFSAMKWITENGAVFSGEKNFILMLDLNMPVMDGWNFLSYFEKLNEEVKKKINIYILTSSIDSRDIERAKNFPAVKQFYSKPLTNRMIKSIMEDDL